MQGLPLQRTTFNGRRAPLLLPNDEREKAIREDERYGKGLPIMKLTPEQETQLEEYYAELEKYNKLRKEDPSYWAEYYAVLRRIKRLLRYGQ